MLSLSSTHAEDKTRLCEDSSVQMPSVIQVQEKSNTLTANACESKVKPSVENCSSKNSSTISTSKREQLSKAEMERSSCVESKEQEAPTIWSRLRQAERYACSSLEIGNSTSVKLREQGDHIRLISNTVDETKYELKKSHRIVRGISSWVGAIKNLFTRSPKPPNSYSYQNTSCCTNTSPTVTEKDKSKTSEECRTDNSNKCSYNSNSKQFKQHGYQRTDYCKGKTDDKEVQENRLQEEMTHFKHEQDKLFDLLHEDVQRLHEQALLHNEMLGHQNECLEKVKQKNEVVCAKLDKTQRNIKDLLERELRLITH